MPDYEGRILSRQARRREKRRAVPSRGDYASASQILRDAGTLDGSETMRSTATPTANRCLTESGRRHASR